jgi:hypothetical protein
MNSSSVASSMYPLGTTTATIPPQLMSEGSVSFGPSRSPSHAWQRFIHTSTQQPDSEATRMVVIVPAKSTTVEGLIALKPTPTLEELLSGPLFRVAGIFEIDEPGWAEKHDEYIAETYL